MKRLYKFINIKGLNSQYKTNYKCQVIMLLHISLAWIFETFDGFKERNVTEFRPLLEKLDTVFYTRGVAEAIRYIKDVRNCIFCYLSGNIENSSKVGKTKDGLPLVLGDLIPKIRGEGFASSLLPALTTIFMVTRSLSIGGNVDLRTITDPVKDQSLCELTLNKLDVHIKSFWRDLGYKPSQRLPRFLNWREYHLTSKKGPNGHALWHSMTDLLNLPITLLESLINVGGPSFHVNVLSLISSLRNGLIPKIIPQSLEGRYRKVSHFSDKEDKVRVIAQLDYFSQTALKPLHRWLYRVLRKIPQDCTFEQGKLLRELLDGNREVYSIDLSAATDRFPIRLIELVLKRQLPTKYVDHWSNIMVGYPFEAPQHNESISYAVGNPMGAYSSWASFAVAHHYVVYYCCKELNIEWSKLPYALLGDDIVIANKDVSELYMSIVKSLGVDVSPAKTHKSKDFCEFAKRYIYHSREITHFPLSSIFHQHMKPSHCEMVRALNTVLEARSKGYATQDVTLSIVELYRRFFRIGRHFRDNPKRMNRLYAAEFILKWMKGLMSAEESISALVRCISHPVRQLSEEECQGILSNLAVELFADSQPSNRVLARQKNPIGKMADSLLDSIIARVDENPQLRNLGHNLLDALPHIACKSGIEESYLRIMEKAKRIDTIERGEWPFILRNTMTPISDDVFSERTSERIVQTSSILADKLIERLDLIHLYQM